ncbi:MAG: aldose 1-epimerase family protein [Huintestinicola sp.]
MNVTISSDKLTVSASSEGAELHSVKDSEGNEYLWTAEDVWRRHAPILFPFVCNTKSKKYSVNGSEYSLSNHGFARDSAFAVSSSEKDSVTFTLVSTEETKSHYPFDFELSVTYSVKGNVLRTECNVKNTGSEKMTFFIGGHPGFLCPFTADKDSTFEDYSIVYEKPETIVQELEGGNVTVLEDGSSVDVTRELFRNDVFMKDKPNSSAVSLVSKKSGRSVTVRYDNSGCIAVWSPYDDRGHFVCLEPWAATPVYCAGTEELTQMPNALNISSGESYSFGFDIVIE